ncbi:MAG: CPBP family glutamic-type intramembrane protease [Pseudomonadota bacterium]
MMRIRPTAQDEAQGTTPGSPYGFFGLLFLLSVPFWLVGAFVGEEILPGLPMSSAMVVCPALAACILVYRSGGAAALRPFLGRAGDFTRMRGWVWAFALGVMPVVMVLSGVIQVALGDPLPPFQFDPVQAVALFGLFFVAATAEEIGWSGHATRPLAEAHGPILAGVIIGAVASLWHLIPLLQVERTLEWIAWWAAGSIARRVCIVWMFVRGGQSVFSTSLFHAMSNLSWMLFPVMGSHYDPMVTGSVLIAATSLLLLISGVRSSGAGRRGAP